MVSFHNFSQWRNFRIDSVVFFFYFSLIEAPEIVAASMWTRKDIRDFKDSIRKEGKESIIKVGHGETVTVRVPTHEDGACLFWEFATDSYVRFFAIR